jgi:chemotaxis protein MotB
MIEFAAEEDEGPSGSPAWMATFADLMSLLMTFFVLLLSFSEMDVQKYKLVAGSMKNAFGIQQQVVATKNPSWSAAPLENYLQEAPTVDSSEIEKAEMLEMLRDLMQETEMDIEKLEEILEDEIQGGFIDLESGFRSITIRIKEKGSFDSGSAELQLEFVPVMAKLRNVLLDIDGKITVEGHTDDIDISTASVLIRYWWNSKPESHAPLFRGAQAVLTASSCSIQARQFWIRFAHTTACRN